MAKAKRVPRGPKAKKKHVKTGTTSGAKEEKRKLFVQALIANGENRTAAAIAAGYSPKTAGAAGARLFKEVKTFELLEAARKKLQDKFGLTAENVTRQLAAIVNYDPRRMFGPGGAMLPIDKWPDDVAHAIGGVETYEKDGDKHERIIKIKVWDKNAGIGNAIKMLGLSRERLPMDPPPGMENAETNLLDAARRVAFTLAMGAALSDKHKRLEAPKKKTPA